MRNKHAIKANIAKIKLLREVERQHRISMRPAIAERREIIRNKS